MPSCAQALAHLGALFLDSSVFPDFLPLLSSRPGANVVWFFEPPMPASMHRHRPRPASPTRAVLAGHSASLCACSLHQHRHPHPCCAQSSLRQRSRRVRIARVSSGSSGSWPRHGSSASPATGPSLPYQSVVAARGAGRRVRFEGRDVAEGTMVVHVNNERTDILTEGGEV